MSVLSQYDPKAFQIVGSVLQLRGGAGLDTTGGTPGQVLGFDGAGDLVPTTVSGGGGGTASPTWKDAALYAQSAPLPAYTASGGGTVLTATANGSLAGFFDGATPAAGQRVMLWLESGGNAIYNGLYVVTTAGAAGGGGTAWVLTLASDANTSALVPPRTRIPIQSGTLYGGDYFELVTPGPIVLGTTPLSFVPTSATVVPFVGTTGAPGKLRKLVGQATGPLSRVQTLGYYAPGDGGEEAYWWSSDTTTPDNGGSCVVPDASVMPTRVGCWKILGDRRKSKSFGAKHDSVTDDTAALQRWLDSASEDVLGQGLELVFSPGACKVTPGAGGWALQLAYAANIRGAGPTTARNGVRLLMHGAGTALLIEHRPHTTAFPDGSVIERVMVAPFSGTQDGTVGVAIHAPNVVVRDCDVRGMTLFGVVGESGASSSSKAATSLPNTVLTADIPAGSFSSFQVADASRVDVGMSLAVGGGNGNFPGVTGIVAVTSVVGTTIGCATTTAPTGGITAAGSSVGYYMYGDFSRLDNVVTTNCGALSGGTRGLDAGGAAVCLRGGDEGGSSVRDCSDTNSNFAYWDDSTAGALWENNYAQGGGTGYRCSGSAGPQYLHCGTETPTGFDGRVRGQAASQSAAATSALIDGGTILSGVLYFPPRTVVSGATYKSVLFFGCQNTGPAGTLTVRLAVPVQDNDGFTGLIYGQADPKTPGTLNTYGIMAWTPLTPSFNYMRAWRYLYRAAGNGWNRPSTDFELGQTDDGHPRAPGCWVAAAPQLNSYRDWTREYSVALPPGDTTLFANGGLTNGGADLGMALPDGTSSYAVSGASNVQPDLQVRFEYLNATDAATKAITLGGAYVVSQSGESGSNSGQYAVIATNASAGTLTVKVRFRYRLYVTSADGHVF